MKRFSYILGFLTVALFLFSAASTVNATGVDPKVALGPTGSNPCSGGEDAACSQDQCLVSDGVCTLQLDSTGSGIADIVNDTGFNLLSDTVNIDTTAFQPPLFCDPTNPFGFDNITGGTGSNTPNTCTWGFFDDPLGIPGGATYGVHFTTFLDANGLPLSSITFDLAARLGDTPATPEPGTILLLGTGLATLVAKRNSLRPRNT